MVEQAVTSDLPAERVSTEVTALTGLRFIAAALVLLHHATMYFAPLPVLAPLSVLGYVGVTFFFVLSGFVLTWSAKPSLSRRRFYGRRVARIGPTYVLTTLLALSLCFLYRLPTGLGPTLAALTATQSWFPHAAYTERLNVVSWSISDEAFFYAILPFVLVRWGVLQRRALWLRVAAVVAAMLVAALLLHAVLPALTADDLLYKLPLLRAGEFLIGVALARVVRSGWRSPVSARSAGGLALATYVVLTVGLDHLGKLTVARWLPDLVMLAPLALLVVACASESLESRSTIRWLGRPAIVSLGQASFQLYMTHFLLILVLIHLLPGDLPPVEQLLVLVLFASVAIGVSLVACRWFERPVERWLRHRIG